MKAISSEKIQAYRNQTFHLRPSQHIKSQEQAIEFANQRGFIFFWPIKDITLPSLWSAVAGDRPVADAHDDPGHVTWGWKDSLLGKRRWYYAKVLRKRATIIALNVVPYFYALSENYGSFEDDYLTLYEQGRMTQEAKKVYEALLQEGPLDTVALRRATQMTSRESDHRFNRAMIELQTDFKILPVGVTQAGGWNYAFAYEIVARHFPDLPDQAHPIREDDARQKLMELYFLSVGAAQLSDAVKLFGWSPAETEKAIDNLVNRGILQHGLKVEDKPRDWIVLTELTRRPRSKEI